MTSGDLVAGKVGKGWEFDGTDDYVGVADSSSLRLTSTGTIELWTKFNNTNACGLVGKDAMANPYGYKIRYGTGKLQFPIDTTGTQGWDSNGYTWVPTTGQWYHIVAVYDGSKKHLYVDGVEKFNQVVTGNIDNTTNSLLIGDTTFDSYFNGTIDEVRISNTARSATFISTTYHNHNSPSTFYTDYAEESKPGAGNIKQIAGVAWASVKQLGTIPEANLKQVAAITAN